MPAAYACAYGVNVACSALADLGQRNVRTGPGTESWVTRQTSEFGGDWRASAGLIGTVSVTGAAFPVWGRSSGQKQRCSVVVALVGRLRLAEKVAEWVEVVEASEILVSEAAAIVGKTEVAQLGGFGRIGTFGGLRIRPA